MRRIALALALATASFAVAAPQSASSLRQNDINQIVAAVLTHKDVVMYLHPESPGRVPVRIDLHAPYSDVPVDLVLYGKPVKVLASADAINLAITPTAEGVTVRVSYRPEGMVGTVLLTKTSNQWTAMRASIYEQ